MRVLIATLKKHDTIHIMHGIENITTPVSTEIEYRTFTDYSFTDIVYKAKQEGFDYLFAVDCNVIFPAITFDVLFRHKEPYVFAIAQQDGISDDFIGCRLVNIKQPISKPKYITSFPLVSYNEKTKATTGNRINMKYCVSNINPYEFMLKETIRTDVRVQFACPKINENDIPVTDFGKLTRNFIAERDDDILMPTGMDIIDAYNYIFETAINRNKTHLIIIESDVIVPTYAVDKLLDDSVVKKHPFVCGVYPFKGGSDICVAIERDENGMSRRLANPYSRRGLVPCTRATPMGCCIVDLDIVQKLDRPWFDNQTVDGEDFSQDAYFSYIFIKNGYTPMVDTDIQCAHVDRMTKECFGSPELIDNKQIKESVKREMATC